MSFQDFIAPLNKRLNAGFTVEQALTLTVQEAHRLNSQIYAELYALNNEIPS